MTTNFSDLDGETFAKMWDSIKDKKTEFTNDEVNKFQKAFDDPEFRKLFASYMDEIQDPKYREETEQYIINFKIVIFIDKLSISYQLKLIFIYF